MNEALRPFRSLQTRAAKQKSKNMQTQRAPQTWPNTKIDYRRTTKFRQKFQHWNQTVQCGGAHSMAKLNDKTYVLMDGQCIPAANTSSGYEDVEVGLAAATAEKTSTMANFV
jgi:hypothetical protein